MRTILAAIGRTLQSIYDPGLWRIILISALLNIVVWTILVSVIWYVLHHTTFSHIGWVEWSIDLLGLGLVAIITLLLFPFTFPLSISLFCERIADRVETKEYPGQFGGKIHTPLHTHLWGEGKFVTISLLLNMLLLPLYIIPGLNVLVLFFYYAVNGYLLGREFFTLVAIRYRSGKEVKTLRKAHKYKLMLAGVMVLMLSSIPLVNILIPAVAVIAMVHLYRRIVESGE